MLSNDEIIRLSVEELSALIQSKEVTSLRVTEAYLEQAEQQNEKINAFISIRRAQAENEAKDADAEIATGKYRGMYHGIPIAIKDNIYVKDEITTMGSEIHKDYVADFDATVVEKLREAGAVLIGKLNLHEYAWGITTNNAHYGPTRNPWDTNKIPGGSSGGSAAAIAAKMAAATLGTDTAGSIRIPSAACGVVGLKPTYGRVSKYGSFPLADSLDHIGPITKTVRDAAGLLSIIAGYDEMDASTSEVPIAPYLASITGDVDGLVIGVDEAYYFTDVDAQVEKLVRNAIQNLVDRGARVEKVSMPTLTETQFMENMIIFSEAVEVHEKSIAEAREKFGQDIQGMLSMMEAPTAPIYIRAKKLAEQLKIEYRKAFKKVDVIITPTLPLLPNNIGEEEGEINGEKVSLVGNILRFTTPSNMAGLPSLSVPCGVASGLPVGIQLIGAPFAETTVLNAGYAIEQMNLMKKHEAQLK